MLEKGVKSCYGKNRKEGFFEAIRNQTLKSIDFHISVKFNFRKKHDFEIPYPFPEFPLLVIETRHMCYHRQI